MEIREAAVADAEALARVYRSAFQENRELGLPHDAESADPERVASWIRDHTVLVAIEDGEVIGGVVLTATDEDRVNIGRLAVREDAKRDGVGDRLLDEAEEWARRQGFTTIWLETPVAHPYLPGMYRRRGYEQAGTREDDGHEFAFVVMEKAVR